MESSLLERRRLLLVSTAAALASYALCQFSKKRRENWPQGRDMYRKEQKSAIRKRNQYKNFPPPYPNGWVFVCSTERLRKKGVYPLNVCGKHLVLFRGEDGQAGVLDALCPHMATHLGHGGFVKGNAVVCPYHEWEFDRKGKLVKMPFGGRATAERGAKECDTRGYQVIEKLGMIFVWLHADNGKPSDLDLLAELEEKGLRPCGHLVDDDFLMHCMEPSHNSADWYHFSTVHSRIAQHWQSKWSLIHVEHDLLPARCALDKSIDDDGKAIEKESWLIVDEKVKSLKLFGVVPLPGAQHFTSTQVRFNGPMVSAFCIKVPFIGNFMLFMNLTPIEPFRTHVEYFCFADWRWPRMLAYTLACLILRTVNQDREVWENRGHPDPRNPVKGDYDYKKYDKWLKQFYSPSSILWDTAYDDLTF